MGGSPYIPMTFTNPMVAPENWQEDVPAYLEHTHRFFKGLYDHLGEVREYFKAAEFDPDGDTDRCFERALSGVDVAHGAMIDATTAAQKFCDEQPLPDFRKAG